MQTAKQLDLYVRGKCASETYSKIPSNLKHKDGKPAQSGRSMQHFTLQGGKSQDKRDNSTKKIRKRQTNSVHK